MNNKKNLGQFFTTNSDYILNGFEYLVKNRDVVDPFCGNCDLLKWAKNNGAKSTFGFDIDTKLIGDGVKWNDSLIALPIINGFSLTNPPYLAKNKMSKEIKNKYLLDDYIDDLYLLSIKKIINSNIQDGIIIVPVNFFSANNSDKIRKQFLNTFQITKIKYFTNQVFEDTTYNVVAFHYFRSSARNTTLQFNILPDNVNYLFNVEEKYNYKIGGRELDEINKVGNTLKIKRLTEKYLNENIGKYNLSCFYNDFLYEKLFSVNEKVKQEIKKNIIILNCIDGKIDKIRAEDIRNYKKDCLVGKNTSRNIAYILIDNININQQEKLIKEFNNKLNNMRNKYFSLFLTNFRDGNRKRISFDFCYNLLSWCWNNIK